MVTTLARASLEGAVVVALIWLLCRMLPRLSATTRTALWWCAAAKFVLALVWVAPIPVPILPESSRVVVEAPRAIQSSGSLPQVSGATPDRLGITPAMSVWPIALIAVWVTGVLVASGIELKRWRRMQTIVRRSQPAPSDLCAASVRLADRVGLRRVPDVRVSEDVETPFVTGLSKPVVLLPAGRFARLSAPQQQMALCHELAHVRRADLWLGCVPATAERLFFFHPLARIAAREYSLWREAACDAAVLDAMGAAPREYGRLLLDLGVARRHAGLAAAGASWSFSSLQRRILMLRNPAPRSLAVRLSAAIALAVAIAAIVPLRLTARPAPAPAAPTNQVAPAPEQTGPQAKDPLNYVFFADDTHTTSSASSDEVERARRFKRPGEQMLWFRQDGREYVLRDPATLQRIGALWGPVNAIGDAQGQLGGKQGALGASQGMIGARQGELGAEQGRLGERQGLLAERQAELAGRLQARADRAALDADRRQVEAQMRALDREMAQLNRRMRELDMPMRELDDQMRALDQDMRALDASMREAVARAETEMRTILDRAIATGAAELVK